MTKNHWCRPLGIFGDATVWYVELAPHSSPMDFAWRLLDSGERSRSRRFVHPLPERQFVCTRAALRIILCEQLQIHNQRLTFEMSAHGKPFALVDGNPVPVSFNVSHSGVHGLIAFAERGRLGVDIEERRVPYDVDGLADMVFAPGEMADIARAPGQQKTDRFLTAWTTKEALLKALGTGLAADPRGLETPFALRHGKTSVIFRLPGTPGPEWRVDVFANSVYIGALAHELISSTAPCSSDH